MQEVINDMFIQRSPEQLTIRWKKRLFASTWVKETLLIFIGLAFFIVPVVNLVSVGTNSRWNGYQSADLLAIPFILIGGILLYRTITVFVNTDQAVITPAELRISSMPFPVIDGVTCVVPISRIESIEAKVISTSSRQGTGHSGVTLTYLVRANLRDGTTKELTTGSIQSAPVHFIVNELNAYLETNR
jgi:hypothetical protein